jgi:hypothetical protein
VARQRFDALVAGKGKVVAGSLSGPVKRTNQMKFPPRA